MQLSFKTGHGVGFYEFYEFSRFVFSSKHQKYERYGDIVAPVEILVKNCIGWDGSRSILIFLICFGHLPAYFSLLNHHISSPGTSENHRKTCGKVSWRYGYDPVHITYPSTRNTSENRLSFFLKIRYVSQFVRKNHLPEIGFPTLFRKFPKWGRKTHFRPI